MFEEALFWLGLAGLIGGIGVGISLLEEGDAFMRNIMFSGAIACVMFIYLDQLGEKTPVSLFLFGFSFFVGSVAGIFIAFAAHGSLRAALVAGGLAGLTLQVMLKILPPGSWGFTGLHDIPEAIDIITTIGAGAGCYYLLRNWGRDTEKWD